MIYINHFVPRMSYNTRGGKKYKSGKKGGNKPVSSCPTAKDYDNCYYGLVLKNQGTAFLIKVNDTEIRAVARGNLKKKRMYVNVNDVVLVSHEPGLMSIEYIIIYKYNSDQTRQLRANGELNFETKDENGNAEINFDNNESDDDDDVFEEIKQLRNQEEELEFIEKKKTLMNNLDDDDPEKMAELELELEAEKEESKQKKEKEEDNKPKSKKQLKKED